MDKLSYALGLGIGQQLAQMGAESISAEDFVQAIKDVIEGKELQVSHREAQVIVQDYFQQQEKKMQAQREAQGKMHKEAGEKFLAENKNKEGIVTLPSGLQYQVLKEGNGKKPTAKDTTVPSLIAAISAASLPHSPCSRSLLVGPKVCSLCRRVLSTASSSLTA